MKTKLSTLIYSLVALFAASSCTDDRIWNDNDIIGNGEATISATIAFKSFDSALDSRTPGKELDKLKNVTILAYNEKGDRLIDSRMYSGKALNIENNNTTSPGNAVNPDNTVSTDKATIKDFSLPYGKYQVYVVANADLTNEDVSTVDKLKGITFTWNSTDISKNDQMFGWFSTDNNAASAATLKDAHVITINKPNLTLTAWLVRLASKVTVAYDAKDLKDDVYIFLKSVQVKDIAKTCALGISNKPKEISELEANGETIKYYTTDTEPTEADFTPEKWGATLSNQKDKNKYGSNHSHDANALFFYENNQGIGKNKAQDANGDKEIDYPDGNDPKPGSGFKDEVRCGTYIEVTAYYRSNNSEQKGHGKIVYRFMLGKNITDNYDAERNYHYKLTLKFNGFANDVDWHIEYEQDPDIKLPNPYYISYLYDKTATIPVEIVGKIKEGSKLKAEIIENGWGPYNYGSTDPVPTTQYYHKGMMNYDYTQKVWNGFLSLRDTGHTTDISPGTAAADANTVNEKYWTDKKRGIREYTTAVGTYNEDGDGEYKVSVDPDDEDVTIFDVPYFTRAKNLVKASGYTGNNPYVSYQRKAVVRFTAELWSPIQGKYVETSKEVDIIQVHRVVNPKGVWRAHDEADNFLIHLMRLETEFTTNPWESTGEFKTFESVGPWSAEVMVQGAYKNGANSQENWIQLSPETGMSTFGTDGKIHGEDGSEIKFNYKPSGTIGENEVRYGIIKVRYHNYTCEHLVFVRQGYAPIPVSTVANATKWYSFNLQSATEMASSPCDEGSLFKRFRLDVPIRPVNNQTYPFQVPITNKDLIIHYSPKGATGVWSDTQINKKWNSWYTPKGSTHFDDVTITRIGEKKISPLKMKVASIDDYLELYNDENVQFGFGLLYDGTATGVQTSVKEAYSYYGIYVHNYNGYSQGHDYYKEGRGMRGCFVYNQTTGAQIFLPIGAAGYGRRKQDEIYSGPFSPGMLIYANRNEFMQENNTDVPWDRPILWDLYRRPGAIYWCYETKEGEILGNSQATDCVAWDFNYITFDFFPISKDMVMDKNDATKTDALRVRCVVPK